MFNIYIEFKEQLLPICILVDLDIIQVFINLNYFKEIVVTNRVICNKAKDCSFQYCPHKTEHEEKKETIFCREIFCTIEARCAVTQEYAKCVLVNKESILN